MKNIKVNFSCSTRYVGSDVNEVMDFEFQDDITQSEIEEVIEEEFTTWLYENANPYWEIQE